MKRYICVKPLTLESYDADGFVIENEYWEIDKGEVFQDDELKFRCVGGKDSIRLENDKQWIEITPETLKEHFEEITDNPELLKGGAKE